MGFQAHRTLDGALVVILDDGASEPARRRHSGRLLCRLLPVINHAAAMNLIVRLRRQIADPPPPVDTAESDVPTQAFDGDDRRRYFRQRRQRDPLGEGQPCTWRMLLIKVAAEVTVTCRRVLVRLSASWPYHDYYRRVCQRIAPSTPHLAPDR